MTKKFHINPTTGNASPCRAEKDGCPYGLAENHYATPAEAREAYEKTMQEEGFHYSPKSSLHRLASSDLVKSLVPRNGKYKEYYASTEAKHLTDKTGPGSKFTDPWINSLEEVVALAHRQRGGLEGDDREMLIAAGADPAAFSDDYRYLMVEASGSLGAAPLDSFPAGTSFKAERTKVGGKVSITATVDVKPEVNKAVIILGRPDGEEEILVTAHPGFPARFSGEDTFAGVEGQTLTAEEVARIAGTRFVSVNTQLVR